MVVAMNSGFDSMNARLINFSKAFKNAVFQIEHPLGQLLRFYV